MTAPQPIADRRWYRRTLFGVTVAAWGALFWFVAQSRGWVPGSPPAASSLLSMTSTSCLLASLAVGRRSWPVAITLMILATAFLVASIAALAHNS